MGNCAFIDTERDMTIPEIHAHCAAICEEYLPGFQVEVGEFEGEFRFLIAHKDAEKHKMGWAYGLNFYLEGTFRRLYIQHRCGDFYWWLHFLIWNSLAERLGGIVSDEGVEGSWEPKVKPEYLSYRKYCCRFKPFATAFGGSKLPLWVGIESPNLREVINCWRKINIFRR